MPVILKCDCGYGKQNIVEQTDGWYIFHLLTQAVRGLGREFCRALGQAGANVVLADINAEAASAAAQENTGKGIE